MLNFREPPHDLRGFVHGSLIKFGAKALGLAPIPGAGLASSFLSSRLNKGAGAAAKFGGGIRGLSRSNPREFYNAQCIAEMGHKRFDWSSCGDQRRAAAQGMAQTLPFTGTPQAISIDFDLPCVFPFRRDPVTGDCRIFAGEGSGPAPAGDVANGGRPGGPPPGHQVRTPVIMPGQRRRCPKRYVLGIDNLCYFGLPRNSKWRKWRPGRRPLFTGGDLNAIRTAGKLAESAEEIFRDTNPAKKAVARNYRANWRKPLKK